MALPVSPNTTYVANSTPAIKADDLNAMQAAIVAAYARGLRTDFGDGADGSPILDGVTWPSWAPGGVMIRDAFCNSLTISAASFQTKAWRIYCRDTFQITNVATVVVPSAGIDGSGNTGGPGFASQTLAGMGTGGSGTGTTGAPGQAQSNSYGGAGGRGGDCLGNLGGIGGTVSPPVGSHGKAYPYSPATFGSLTGGGTMVLITGGGSGGAGGGDGTTLEGGGAGGGVIAIAARNIILAAAGNLKAAGGAGGQATSSPGSIGGGGGGGGGALLLAYQTLTVLSGTMSGSLNCPGGIAGSGFGVSASPGLAGSSGTVTLIQL
jgi:hypothetical protein